MAPATAAAKRRCFASLAHWLSGTGCRPAEATPGHIPRVRAYIAAVAERRGVHAALELCNHVCRFARGGAHAGPLYARAAAAREGLRRMLHLLDPRQARPLPLRVALRLSRLPPTRERLVSQLLWFAAARLSDVARLRAADVAMEGDGWTRLRYRITKTEQRGTVRMALIRLPPAAAGHLRAVLAATPPGGTPFAMTAAHLNGWIRRVVGPYSTHSFRRGAVQTLLDHGVDERRVARLTGHKDLATLLVYADRLGVRARRSMAQCAEVLAGRT